MRKFPFFLLLAILFVGLVIRLYFVNKHIFGDLLVHMEWGERYWDLGPKEFYYDEDWYWSRPTQPPLTSLLFAGSYWLYDHKYRLAELHNLIKIPPAFFIIYFYDWGYVLLLKLPAIIADLLLCLLIYKIVGDLTKNKNRALIAAAFYLFNPVTILLSSIWGQTESLLALFGVLAFVLPHYKKAWLAIPAFFVCLFIKPTWIITLPLFIVVFILHKPKLRDLLLGSFVAILIFVVTTRVFATGDLLSFAYQKFVVEILPSSKGTSKATISAFNLYSLVFTIDRQLDTQKVLLIPARVLGLLAYATINLVALGLLRKKKANLVAIISSLFVVGLGSGLFLTNILERYLFVGFVPLVILIASDTRMVVWGLVINVVFFGNLLWAFFRRNIGPIDHFFTTNNFLIMRLASLFEVVSYIQIANRLHRKH